MDRLRRSTFAPRKSTPPPPMRTKLSGFIFELPDELVAKYPAERRDESRLLVVHRDSGKIEHRVFKDVLDYFETGDTFMMNNTKVFPARMYGKKEKTEANIEVFLLRELSKEQKLWDVIVDPARKIRVGNKLFFPDDEGNDLLTAEVVDNTTSRGRTIRFMNEISDEEFRGLIHKLGNTPLPKYIDRPVEDLDEERYQTLFAEEEGAVAAPTAGLHFSEALLKRMELKGVNRAMLTLHVGLGTFREIEVEDLSKHKMDAEYFKVTKETADLVQRTKNDGHNVCAVGTTVMRAVESSVSADDLVAPNIGWTNKFIYPPYKFHVADSMITNMHLPKSSLFIMACAFGGTDLVHEAYQEAIKEKYRFYTYGDAMLIL